MGELNKRTIKNEAIVRKAVRQLLIEKRIVR